MIILIKIPDQDKPKLDKILSNRPWSSFQLSDAQWLDVKQSIKELKIKNQESINE